MAMYRSSCFLDLASVVPSHMIEKGESNGRACSVVSTEMGVTKYTLWSIRQADVGHLL